MAEFTFFVDAEHYAMQGGELAAVEQDLFDHRIRKVDIPTEFGADLSVRIPVRVDATPAGLRFYGKLLGVRDATQLADLERVIAAAVARGEDIDDLR